MVTFIPPYLGQEITSNAERKMFDILQQLDMPDTFVFHSLGLPRHRSKRYGEVDFVVVCPRGVACLEIKGGRVSCENGNWKFIDRYGNEHSRPEGPFAQVKGNMYSLREVLEKQFGFSYKTRNLLVACGVVFPDIEFLSRGEEVIPEIVYDTRTDSITDYINEVFDYWESRERNDVTKLSIVDIKQIVKYLRGDFTFIPVLRDVLDDTERRLIRLTEQQKMIMDALSANEHLLIDGGAGTGKTVLAVDYAVKQANAGRRVLYLTFNKNLVESIRQQAGNVENLRIINLHALLSECVDLGKHDVKADAGKFFNETLPTAYWEYMAGLTAEELAGRQYDTVIMDEGQDILRPLNLEAIDIILTGGLEKGRWAVFYDAKQNIYNPDFEAGMEKISAYSCTRFILTINCRNTIQIGSYSAKESGLEIREFLQEAGEEVQRIKYTDEADFKDKVTDIVKNLKKEKVAPKDIVFLSPKRYNHSLLGKCNYPVNEIENKADANPNLPYFATIQGFKGLDSKVVIMTDVDKILPENHAKYYYIAGTRARALLYVLSPAGNKK